MRQFLSLLLAAVLALSACSQPQNNNSDSGQSASTSQQETVSDTTPPETQPDSAVPTVSGAENILIAYFSLWDNAPWGEAVDTMTSASVVVDQTGAVGTSAYVAQMIQRAVGGDLHLIIAAEPYPADFDEVVDENHQESSRSLSSKVENMEQYDVVFLGYPDWWTTCPMAVFTFLDSYDFTGKTVIPFCAHGTSGLASSVRDIKAALPGVTVLDTPNEMARATVTNWLADLEY